MSKKWWNGRWPDPKEWGEGLLNVNRKEDDEIPLIVWSKPHTQKSEKIHP